MDKITLARTVALTEAALVCDDYARELVGKQWGQFDSAAFVALLVGVADECKTRIQALSTTQSWEEIVTMFETILAEEARQK